jgi:N-acylglucosamine 2-epimerase (GlcNAc 2-epimerase)
MNRRTDSGLPRCPRSYHDAATRRCAHPPRRVRDRVGARRGRNIGADRWFVDHRRGGWYCVRTPAGAVSETPWPGKPDLYHALHAHLVPLVPDAASVVGGLTDRDGTARGDTRR